MTNVTIYKTLNFLTTSSLLLAFNASMVIAFGFLLYNTPIIPSLLLAAFLVTFAVYGLNKITDKKEDSINKPESTPKRTEYYLWLSIFSMAAGLLIGLSESILAMVILSMPLVIGITYSMKISKTIPRLKEITGVKSLAVAVSWALSGCLLPAGRSFILNETIFLFFIFITLKIFVGAVLFDVLDMKGDGALGIQTIPVKLGADTTKKLLIAVNSFSLFLPVCCILNSALIEFAAIFIFGVIYGYLAIWWFFSKRCSRITAGLMLDGEWLPLVIVAFALLK